jgi:DNA-binding XRE family transcriptional regulator
MARLGGTVYAIGTEPGQPIKIGSTNGNVQHRLRALQIGHPSLLHVFAHVAVDMDARRIEKTIHTFLKEERQRGEWFSINIDQVQLEALIVRAVQWIMKEKALKEAQGSLHACSPFQGNTGERIALIRRRRKMTQKQLGEAVGLHANTIARLERGVLPDIPSQAMGRVAQALGCPSDFLLGLSEDIESELVAAVAP